MFMVFECLIEEVIWTGGNSFFSVVKIAISFISFSLLVCKIEHYIANLTSGSVGF